MKLNSNSSNNKCLFLWYDKKQFHAIEAEKRGIDVANIYKRANLMFRAIRRAHIKLKIPFITFWLSSWKNETHNYDVIILHASKITVPLAKFIKRKNPNIRIIVWYWNPVDKSVPSNAFPDSICEKWSFDESDCEKYGLNYNTQYYFSDINLPNNKLKFDICFVGGDKGRIEDLLKLETNIKEYGLSTYFHITQTKNSPEKYSDIYKDRISYNGILKIISKSNAILDFVSENQTGLTLRPLEALFFKKKLITNDMNIAGRDFYDKENIFILGIDNLKNLPAFLNRPFKEIDQEIICRYDFNSWLKRFLLKR